MPVVPLSSRATIRRKALEEAARAVEALTEAPRSDEAQKALEEAVEVIRSLKEGE